VTPLALSPGELLTTTRSVRRRLDFDRPVSRALVEECLDVAMQAHWDSKQAFDLLFS
jgi:hypothetical protein